MPPSGARDFVGQVRRNYDLYLLLVPGLAFLALFKFVPIYGLVIAFQDFQIFRGIAGSPWVGLAHFQRLFRSEEFYSVLRNTLLISLYKVVFVTPFPIVIALLLNEVGNMKVRRTIQTIIYLPHFLSWVIVSGLFTTILSATGVVNELVRALGREPMLFLVDKRFFRGVLVVSHGLEGGGLGGHRLHRGDHGGRPEPLRGRGHRRRGPAAPDVGGHAAVDRLDDRAHVHHPPEPHPSGAGASRF